VNDPRWHAELLLGHLLALPRHELYLRPDVVLPPEAAARFGDMITRRAAGEPTQYITGVTEFYGLELSCDRRALIPRPETEHLVDKALEIARPITRRPYAILDLGTGSGCVAVCLAVHLSEVQIVASDLSQEALQLARQNATHHGVAEQIEFRHSDLFAEIPESFDLVTANLPYVASGDRHLLQREVRDWEPASALFAGADGLEYLEPAIRMAPDHIWPGGHLMLEIGAHQLSSVKGLIDSVGRFEPVTYVADYQGHPRVVAARKM
jgi:release factor glutamine methyltransferase